MSVRAIDGSVPANTGLSFAYSLVYLFAVLAVAYLFSAVMRSSVYSLMLTFFTFFLILPIVGAVGEFAKFKAWFSITFASRDPTNILQTPYPTDKVITTAGGGGFGAGPAAAGQTISVAQLLPDDNAEPCGNGGVFHRRVHVAHESLRGGGRCKCRGKTLFRVLRRRRERFWKQLCQSRKSFLSTVISK